MAPEINNDIAATTINAGETLISKSAEKSTMGMSGLQRNSSDGHWLLQCRFTYWGTVSFSGGSISVNVRPRNVASTISSRHDSKDKSTGLNSEAFSDFELIEKNRRRWDGYCPIQLARAQLTV